MDLSPQSDASLPAPANKEPDLNVLHTVCRASTNLKIFINGFPVKSQQSKAVPVYAELHGEILPAGQADRATPVPRPGREAGQAAGAGGGGGDRAALLHPHRLPVWPVLGSL